MKHTKGEWNVGKYEQGLTIYGGGGSNKLGIVAIDLFNNEQEANAKLMAAAPYQHEKHIQNEELCDKLLDHIMNNDTSYALAVLAAIKANCINAHQKATQ